MASLAFFPMLDMDVAATYPNVVCIGGSSHTVMRKEHVTKTDDLCTQRHVSLGTRRLYEYFDSDTPSIGGPVRVHVHAHDRNASVNKYRREKRPGTLNQNDTWHAAKSVERAINIVGKGSKRQHGQTLHEEISDKIHFVRVYVQYSIRNCHNDPRILRENLDNVVEHYKQKYMGELFGFESRCRQDPYYEPRKLLIRDPKSFEDGYTEDWSTCTSPPEDGYTVDWSTMDTFYVEYFNNVLNIFLDKRIHFGDESYKMRTSLAICHWNENVDRQATSMYQATSGRTKRTLGPRTYAYRERIWRRFIHDRV